MKSKTIKLLVFRLTNDCNLRCKYCYARGGESKETMSLEIAQKAINYAANYSNSFKIQFTGGEPLLAKDLIEKIINYGHKQKLTIAYQLQSNGTLINLETARWLKEMKIAMGISLDGLPAVNDKLRVFTTGKGSATATITGLQNLRSQGIIVGLTATVTRYNVGYLPDLVELAAYLGNVYGISLDLYRPIGRGRESEFSVDDFTLLQTQVHKCIEKATEIRQLGGKQVSLREIERISSQLKTGLKRNHYCYAVAGNSFAVIPTGEVYPCSSLADYPELSLGNIMSEDFALFNNLEPFLKGASLKEIKSCQSCSDNQLCAGGCVARAYGYTGKLNQVYAGDCILKKTYIKLARISSPSKETTISL